MVRLAERAIAYLKRACRPWLLACAAVLGPALLYAGWWVGSEAAMTSSGQGAAPQAPALLSAAGAMLLVAAGLATLAAAGWELARRLATLPLNDRPFEPDGDPNRDLSGSALSYPPERDWMTTIGAGATLPGALGPAPGGPGWQEGRSASRRLAQREAAWPPERPMPPAEVARLMRATVERLESEVVELQSNCADLAVLAEGTRRTSGAAATLATTTRQGLAELESAFDACAAGNRAAAAALASCMANARALEKTAASSHGAAGERVPLNALVRAQTTTEPARQEPQDAAASTPARLRADAHQVAELAASASRSLDEAEQAMHRQREALRDLRVRLAALASDTASVHRMVSSQVEYGQFNIHASANIASHAERLCDGAHQLGDGR